MNNIDETSKQPDPDEPTLPDKEYQAVCIDTSVFRDIGYDFQGTLLDLLKGFSDGVFPLLMPDVIRNELITHMVDSADHCKKALCESIDKAKRALPPIVDASNSLEQHLASLPDSYTIASSRIDAFIAQTGCVVLDSDEYVKPSDVLDGYFSLRPPFGPEKKKKHEFPDAFAVLAVARWAEQNTKNVLLVSKDDGWMRYSESHPRLECTKNLFLASKAFSEQRDVLSSVGRLSEVLFVAGEAAPINDQIFNALQQKLHDVGDDILFCGPCQTVETDTNAELQSVQPDPEFFHLIEQKPDSFVIGATFTVDIELQIDAEYLVWDSIDKETISIGSEYQELPFALFVSTIIELTGSLSSSIEELALLELDLVEVDGIPPEIDLEPANWRD